MFRRLFGTVAIGALVMLAVPTDAQAQMPDKPEGTEMTVSGTVIDLSCKCRHNLSGADHRMCAQVCADRGVPLAILGDDGTLYIPVSEAMYKVGPLAYPPNPTTASGRNFLMIDLAFIRLPASLNGKLTLRMICFR